MASTNKTTNYELSQFIQTDKPAWLGDYNLDMSKIDAQMKLNADGVSTNASNIATNTSNIEANATAIGGLQNETSSLDSRVDVLESELNLNQISTFDCSTLSNEDFAGTITLQQNDAGTFFKLYGTFKVNTSNNTITIQKTQVPSLTINGSPVYGFKTTLQLRTSVQQALYADNNGIRTVAYKETSGRNTLNEIGSASLAVGSDGFIYLTGWSPISQNFTFYNNREYYTNYIDTLIINKDFNVVPTA